MAALPPPPSKIPDMIFRAYEERNSEFDGLGFSPSMFSTDCDRYLWFALRWAFPKEKITGRTLRLFQSGHIGESRMIQDLRDAGLEVYDVDEDGKQFPVRALADHVRGKMDGLCKGVPEAPAKWHVVEIKTANAKSFAKIKKDGVAKAKPDYAIQALIYMGIRGIDRCLFCVACKDNDDIHIERLKFDHEAFTRLMARLERILRSPEPPAGICRDANDFNGKFCRARALCFENSFPRIHCRTCVHSSPEMTGNAAWSCARHVKPLTPDEQRAGCPNHLLIPQLVPGEMLDVDEQAETISYRLHDGREWTDGRDVSEQPVEVEGKEGE